MEILAHALQCEFKTLDASGSFEGYASISGNVDQGGDIIKRGAWREFATDKKDRVKILYQHDRRSPIGLAEVKEDRTGLAFKGSLVLDDPTGARAYALIKAEVLDGMSIGFDVLDGGSKMLNSGVRELTALKLWEISPVTWGMNPLARITGVKHTPLTIREFEEFLRDAGGYSKAHAQAIAAGGFKALHVADARDALTPQQAADMLGNIARKALSLT